MPAASRVSASGRHGVVRADGGDAAVLDEHVGGANGDGIGVDGRAAANEKSHAVNLSQKLF